MVEERQTIIRFLLGEMSDQERAVFEDETFKDDNLFHRVAECENDLMDLYAIGALSPAEQERFDAFLLTPERRGRLAFSRALMNSPTQKSEVRPRNMPAGRLSPLPWLRSVSARLAVGAALCLSLAGTSVWLFVANQKLRSEIQTLHQHDETVSQKATGLQEQLDDISRRLEASSHVPNALRSIVSFTLSSDAVRGNGKVPELSIPPAASFVQLHLVFPRDSFSTYRVSVESANGAHIWNGNVSSSKDLDGLTRQLTLEIPARALNAGYYVLQITAKKGEETEDVAGYAFKIANR